MKVEYKIGSLLENQPGLTANKEIKPIFRSPRSPRMDVFPDYWILAYGYFTYRPHGPIINLFEPSKMLRTEKPLGLELENDSKSKREIALSK